MSGPLSCLACLERAARCRGLCDRCLSRARRAVATGETTWDRLQALGLALPPQKAGEAWRRGFTLNASGPLPLPPAGAP